jgi:hypothetical protein
MSHFLERLVLRSSDNRRTSDVKPALVPEMLPETFAPFPQQRTPPLPLSPTSQTSEEATPVLVEEQEPQSTPQMTVESETEERISTTNPAPPKVEMEREAISPIEEELSDVSKTQINVTETPPPNGRRELPIPREEKRNEKKRELPQPAFVEPQLPPAPVMTVESEPERRRPTPKKVGPPKVETGRKFATPSDKMAPQPGREEAKRLDVVVDKTETKVTEPILPPVKVARSERGDLEVRASIPREQKRNEKTQEMVEAVRTIQASTSRLAPIIPKWVTELPLSAPLEVPDLGETTMTLDRLGEKSGEEEKRGTSGESPLPSQFQPFSRERPVVLPQRSLSFNQPKSRSAAAEKEKTIPETLNDEPSVTVSIGRIEVRAITPERATPKPKSIPTLSLEEYLKRRREGSF